MNNFTHQFHTKGQEIRMDAAERSRVLMMLQAKMNEQKPVASTFWNPFLPRLAAAFAIVLVVSGGTAYAAEGALPGDLLYPVKVGAVEPLQGAFAFSSSAKAEWNAAVAAERLDEAQTLAAKGTLTSATGAELAANFAEHASGVAAAADDVSVSDPASGSAIRARFTATVATRGAAILLAGKQGQNASSATASGHLVVAVATDEDTDAQTISATAQPMMKSATTFSVPTTGAEAAAARLSVEAHAALANATGSIAARKLSRDAAGEPNARAAQIANRIVKADAELSIGSADAAVTDFNRALRDISALTASLNDADATRPSSLTPENASVHTLTSSPSLAPSLRK